MIAVRRRRPPKENISLNDAMENMKEGSHLEKTQSSRVVSTSLESCMTTRLQTPNPATAIKMPAEPPANADMTETMA